MGIPAVRCEMNRLLAALPEADYQRLLPHLELVPMPLGWTVYEEGGVQRHVYFPEDCLVSLLHVMENGASAGVAVIGNEGMVGVTLFMGSETTSRRAVVYSAGYGYRLKASVLKSEFERGGALQHLALRYTMSLIVQIMQTAVCNRHHSVEQQLCRLLLLTHDRLPTNEMILTQELMSTLLGVRREGISEAAGRLQAAGLISNARRRITVLDRPKLEAHACECYAVVKREYDRLLCVAVQPASVRFPALRTAASNRLRSPDLVEQ